jgi:hypothetical protein
VPTGGVEAVRRNVALLGAEHPGSVEVGELPAEQPLGGAKLAGGVGGRERAGRLVMEQEQEVELDDRVHVLADERADLPGDGAAARHLGVWGEPGLGQGFAAHRGGP